MVVLVLLVLALFVLQTLLPGRFREPGPPGAPGKLAENLGNRDHMRPLTVTGAARRTRLANMQEALPVFLALALHEPDRGAGATLATTGAPCSWWRGCCTSLSTSRASPVVRTLHLGGELVGPGDDADAAARADLKAKAPGPLPGPGLCLSAIQDGLASFFSCSLISLRSAFICLVSIGRISLMKHLSRPDDHLLELVHGAGRGGHGDGMRELQVRAIAGHPDEVGLVDARPDHQLVLRHRGPAASRFFM